MRLMEANGVYAMSKIIDGLNDAVAYAKGDKTRGATLRATDYLVPRAWENAGQRSQQLALIERAMADAQAIKKKGE